MLHADNLLYSNFYAQTHYSILCHFPKFPYSIFRCLQYGFPYGKIGNYSTGSRTLDTSFINIT